MSTIQEVDVGDIVSFMTRAHPTMGEPYEVIGRVGRDVRGMHAGNRRVPVDGITIIQKASASGDCRERFERWTKAKYPQPTMDRSGESYANAWRHAQWQGYEEAWAERDRMGEQAVNDQLEDLRINHIEMMEKMTND